MTRSSPNKSAPPSRPRFPSSVQGRGHLLRQNRSARGESALSQNAPEPRGPAMPRHCSVCASPELAGIVKAICSGVSLRAASKRFGLTASSIDRHKSRCMRIARQQKTGETSANGPARVSREKTHRFAKEAPSSADDSASADSDLSVRSMLRERLAAAYDRGDDDTIAKLGRTLLAWEGGGDAPGDLARGQHCECCSLRLFGVMPEEVLREVNALIAGSVTDNKTLARKRGGRRFRAF